MTEGIEEAVHTDDTSDRFIWHEGELIEDKPARALREAQERARTQVPIDETEPVREDMLP